MQPPHLFHSVANRPRGRRGDHELAGNYLVVPGKPCVSPATRNSRVRGKRWGERLEQFLSWGRQERGSPDRTANSERCFLMSLSLGGGSLLQCHGGSASDCTAPPCWSQIVYTSRPSCDLRRCPAEVRGNPPDIQGVPTQTTACNRSPAPPSRRAGPTAGRGRRWSLAPAMGAPRSP